MGENRPPIRQSRYILYRRGAEQPVEGAVPVEEQIALYVNGAVLVGLMCTPVLVEELALGFLYNEGLIEGMEEVAEVRLCGSGQCVDVWLYKDIEQPLMRTVTSGCSGGTTFESLREAHHPVASNLQITPAQVFDLIERLQESATLYHQARGIHASGLAGGNGLVCVAEDVGRHNTVDKLAGVCLRQGLPMKDHILVTSGRVSSEMLGKAARMEVPVVISRTSPTSLSVELARAWGITLIGYARRPVFHIYAGEHRVVGTTEPEAEERRPHK